MSLREGQTEHIFRDSLHQNLKERFVYAPQCIILGGSPDVCRVVGRWEAFDSRPSFFLSGSMRISPLFILWIFGVSIRQRGGSITGRPVLVFSSTCAHLLAAGVLTNCAVSQLKGPEALHMSLAISHPLPACEDSASRSCNNNSSAIFCECHCSTRTLRLRSVHTRTRNYTTEAGDRGERGEGGGGGGRAMAERERDTCVLYHEEDGIATLTLNRPKVKGLANNRCRHKLNLMCQWSTYI